MVRSFFPADSGGHAAPELLGALGGAAHLCPATGLRAYGAALRLASRRRLRLDVPPQERHLRVEVVQLVVTLCRRLCSWKVPLGAQPEYRQQAPATAGVGQRNF